MIKLFLFVNIFIKNGVKFLSWHNKSIIDFCMLFGEWISNFSFEGIFFFKYIWQFISFSTHRWWSWEANVWSAWGLHSTDVNWCGCPSRKWFLVSTRRHTLCSLFHLFDFGLELLQIGPKFLIQGSVQIRVIFFDVVCLIVLDLLLFRGISQIELYLMLSHFLISELFDCFKVAFIQGYNLYADFIIHSWKITFKCLFLLLQLF